MVVERGKTNNLKLADMLFEKHKALFQEAEDGEVKPMLFNGVPKENIQATFDLFYQYSSSYDMIIQWITQSGEFKYDYSWLSPAQSKDTFQVWARSIFKSNFDIFPEDLKLL